jgi:hypothetical protein
MRAVVTEEVTAIPSEVRVRRWVSVISLCVAVISAAGQTSPSEYQPGTIMGVTEHHPAGQQDTEATRYDVSVKVGNTTFVVLLTPPSGSKSVTYAVGSSLLVLVGSDTLTFNRGSEKTEVPILSREVAPSQTVDWAKAPGQYFSMKLANLPKKLALTDAQRTEFKPILEQETGEVGQIFANPVLSREDKLKQYEKIVRSSDKKLQPLLSASQREKLQDLRNQQKQDLKQLMAEEKKGKQE